MYLNVNLPELPTSRPHWRSGMNAVLNHSLPLDAKLN